MNSVDRLGFNEVRGRVQRILKIFAKLFLASVCRTCIRCKKCLEYDVAAYVWSPTCSIGNISCVHEAWVLFSSSRYLVGSYASPSSTFSTWCVLQRITHSRGIRGVNLASSARWLVRRAILVHQRMLIAWSTCWTVVCQKSARLLSTLTSSCVLPGCQ